MAKKISIQEFGMSEDFRKRSFPVVEQRWQIGLWEPFFYREGDQVFQNPKCQMTWADFLKLYKEIC